MGYNPLNGKFYFFKRNPYISPQEFMSFDPATNLYAMLAPSPVGAGNIINLGCVNNSGLGYYCLDAMGALYYYRISTNTWTTICTNIRDQFNTTLFSVIDPMGLQRYYGDIAIDGAGSMWMLISGAVDYGLYKIKGPLPTTPVANLTATRLIPPTTASPAGSFGGMAFASNGDILVSSNAPNDRLFRMDSTRTLTFVANLSVSGVGNDLTSCNFPLEVLASNKVNLSASVVNETTVVLKGNVTEIFNGITYAIEHSTDGILWDQISIPQITSNNEQNTFTYSERQLVGGTHYYRIRISKPGGTREYSTIEKIIIVSSVSIAIWPNPVQTVLKVQTRNVGPGKSWINVHDNTGRIIKRSLMNAGMNSIDLQSLPSGNYIVRIQHVNGEIINRKFVKQ
jgi:hypothetical protein